MRHFRGVIGGMGPLANSDFLRKLVDHTSAKNNQENIRVIVYGDCTTPDRTESIIGDGPSPFPQLPEAVQFLNGAGVGTICITCNSAHHWHSELEKHSEVPVLTLSSRAHTRFARRIPITKKNSPSR